MNLQMTEEEGIDWCNLWNCYVPAKVTTFVWKLLQNRIPTKDNLAQRGVIQQGDKMQGMLPTNRGCSYFTHVDGSQKYGEQCSHGWVFQFSTVTHNEVKQKNLQFKGTLKQMKLKQKIGMVICTSQVT